MLHINMTFYDDMMAELIMSVKTEKSQQSGYALLSNRRKFGAP